MKQYIVQLVASVYYGQKNHTEGDATLFRETEMLSGTFSEANLF